MKIVVITGSTRGIGFGLADAFLELGNAVIICGRGQDSVQTALAPLITAANELSGILKRTGRGAPTVIT